MFAGASLRDFTQPVTRGNATPRRWGPPLLYFALPPRVSPLRDPAAAAAAARAPPGPPRSPRSVPPRDTTEKKIYT